ncbi:hypothetical protein [Microcoleus sp. B3-A4]|uniref:hypothetical protein n=1 Tax=Microcoleus sp. B3-A4 TaxID=2818653 RepID=UPI002FD03A53
MITHRIAPALRADKMFVLENGSILASGSPRDLLLQKRTPTTLWQQVMREIPMLWELPVSRAVQSNQKIISCYAA